MSSNRPILRLRTLVLVSVVGMVSFACGLLLGPAVSIPTPTNAPSSSPSPSASATTSPTPTRTSTATATPTATALPPIYLTLNVNEYSGFTVYWKRTLWENAVRGTATTEDFESDTADYGELSFPYLTGNGILLTGHSTAQILKDETLLPSGNLLLFRDWQGGLTFSFPYGAAVSAFGFEYKPTEDWRLTFNNSEIPIPKGRRGFVGVVVSQDYPREFVLSGTEGAQGGLSVDNLSYVTTSSP
jgi:hypothetical protein